MHDKTGKIFKEKFVHQMGKSLKFTSSCGSLKVCRAGHVLFFRLRACAFTLLGKALRAPGGSSSRLRFRAFFYSLK
jgi:hypothetical protein